MVRYLLLHAFPFDAGMWDDVAAVLREAGHEVIAADLPGFGATALPAGEPDLDRLIDDVLPRLDDEPAIVVGCSMGGYVAFGIARDRPDLVTALALVDTKATDDASAARAKRERIAALAESGGDWSAGMVEGLLGATSRSGRPDVVRRVEDSLARASGASVAWAQRAMAARPDSREVLSSLTVPVLVVVGDEDTMSPLPEQDLMIDAAPHAQLIVIPEAGHLPPLEVPAEVAAALLTLANPR